MERGATERRENSSAFLYIQKTRKHPVFIIIITINSIVVEDITNGNVYR